ncbi:hypothetical protein DFH09DRAFT_1276425 [Mycena vulgaris]|nr:hypothetical protein DFH09DRAFT_1276425 [Mycena vulgaris]
MPAERTRGSRRTGADGTQLVWTQPVAPAAPGAGGIAFATNLTPTTFAADVDADAESTFQCDAPPLVESLPQPACETQAPSFFIFEPTSPPPGPKRPSHKRKAAPSSPSPSSSASPSSPDGTLSAIAGLTWAALPPADRGLWHAKAREAREEHQERFPGYAFRPKRAAPPTATSKDAEGEECTVKKKKKGKADSPAPALRRRCRDAPPPDRARCAHIASLLVQGLSGAALDEAIKTFDGAREGGVEVRFGEVVTPEMGGVESKTAGSGPARERKTSTRAGGKEKADGARERKTSPAKRTRKVKTEPASPSPSSPTPDDAPSSPATDAPAPFDFPLSLDMDLSALDWAYDASYPPSPSSPFDAASPFSYPPTPGFDSPFSTPPASPALSHASAASPSRLSACSSSSSLSSLASLDSAAFDSPLSTPPLSACPSLEDLRAFAAYPQFDAAQFDLACYASYTPSFDASFAASSCGAFDAAAMGAPYDLDLGLAYAGMGVGVGEYLTSYAEGSEGMGMWRAGDEAWALGVVVDRRRLRGAPTSRRGTHPSPPLPPGRGGRRRRRRGGPPDGRPAVKPAGGGGARPSWACPLVAVSCTPHPDALAGFLFTGRIAVVVVPPPPHPLPPPSHPRSLLLTRHTRSFIPTYPARITYPYPAPPRPPRHPAISKILYHRVLLPCDT